MSFCEEYEECSVSIDFNVLSFKQITNWKTNNMHGCKISGARHLWNDMSFGSNSFSQSLDQSKFSQCWSLWSCR